MLRIHVRILKYVFCNIVDPSVASIAILLQLQMSRQERLWDTLLIYQTNHKQQLLEEV